MGALIGALGITRILGGPVRANTWGSQVQFTMGLASLTIGYFYRYVDNITSIPHPPHTHPAPGIMFRGPGGRLMIRTICGGAEPKATQAFWSDPHEAGSGGTGRRVTAHLRVLEAPGAGGGNPHWKIRAEAEVAASTCHRPCCAGGPGCARSKGGERSPRAWRGPATRSCSGSSLRDRAQPGRGEPGSSTF